MFLRDSEALALDWPSLVRKASEETREIGENIRMAQQGTETDFRRD